LYLIAQNLNVCADSANVDVKLVAPANVSIQNTPACTGQLLTLRMVVPNDTVPGLKNIKWFNKGVKIAENINPIQYSASGNYTVIYSNIYCKDTANSNIVFNPSPVVQKEPQKEFCPEFNPEIQLDAGQYAKYIWQSDTSVKVRYYQATKEGEYKVLVYNQYGCSAEKIFSVKELCKPRLFVPNAFTPGGNNNNLFKVQYANVKNYQMLIFNRWGEIIFESLDPAISWDGMYRNEMMPVGVYAWVVTYEGNREQYKGPYKAQGSVTLIR
jgi:gliding motility-associated-like protein